jgi:RND family efflux transporter MFP subunit
MGSPFPGDMRRGHPTFWLCVLLLSCGVVLTGCGRSPPPPADSAPPVVTVSLPVEREVTDYADFTGRTAAVDSVEVRARVWGYLHKVKFKEGDLVKKGQVLFEIDPRTYETNLEQAEGNLKSMEARLERLKADLARAERLVRNRAIGREEYDKVAGDRAEAAASLQGLRAAVERAKLDLSFTKVTAPISGRASRYNVTVGNLVQSGEQAGGTLLTTIVSVDPMYVYFDVDEHTVLRVRQMIREGKARSARDVKIPAFLGLANEDGHPHRGTLDFVDNRVDPKTGTLRVRGVFPNKDEALAPGYFARVRVPIGNPHKALLVTDRAIDTDQGQKIVYLVNEKNEVVTRPVRVGARHHGLRVIDEGLKPGERVIVVGLQQVRPGLVVEPKLVEMPTGPAVEGRAEAGKAPKDVQPTNSQEP